jgi:lipid-binding SYLF domain-containing protein
MASHRLSQVYGLLTLTVVGLLVGCATAPKTDGAKADLTTQCGQTIADYKTKDPSTTQHFDTALGYAVFPTVTKGGAGIGGAHGRGMLYEGGKAVGYCDLTQATIGLQLGGQKYSEVIYFQDSAALEAFKAGKYAFSAQANAIALASGAAADANYRNGVLVVTYPRSGLMAEASLGGQRFRYEALATK